MMSSRRQRFRAGVTLIEPLCAIAIILALAGLVLGPACRALHRARAEKWHQDSDARLDDTVPQLRTRFQGRTDFPPVTQEKIEADRLVGALELRFLKDPRVTFTPFAGADPDDKLVIQVEVEQGFLAEDGPRTASKGEITKVPE